MSASHHASFSLATLVVISLPLVVGCKPPSVPGGLSSSAEQAQPQTTPVANQPAVDAAANGTAFDFAPSADTPASVAPASNTPPSVPPPSGPPLVANPGLIPADVANSRGPQVAAAGQAAPQPVGSQVTAARSPAIQLSAGVAVPTSLPGGTQMGISVDYAIRGQLNRYARYLWVIASEAGEIESEVKLGVSGNLNCIVPLRPDDRPFNVRIDEVLSGGQRTRVSNVAVMQTNY